MMVRSGGINKMMDSLVNILKCIFLWRNSDSKELVSTWFQLSPHANKPEASGNTVSERVCPLPYNTIASDGSSRAHTQFSVTLREYSGTRLITILAFITMIYDCLFTCLSSPLFCEFFAYIPSAREMPDTGKEGNKLSFNGWIKERTDACMHLPPKASVKLSSKQDEGGVGTPPRITSHHTVCFWTICYHNRSQSVLKQRGPQAHNSLLSIKTISAHLYHISHTSCMLPLVIIRHCHVSPPATYFNLLK